MLTTHEDGTAVLFFYDEDATTRVGLGVGSDGSGLLGMLGENSLTRVIVQEAGDSGKMVLCDPAGSPIWSAP